MTAEGHDRPYLQSRIREEMDRARRYGHPFSLLVLEAHPAADGLPIRKRVDMAIERVCAGLRPSDIVARKLESFGIEEDEDVYKLLIKSKKNFMPYLVLPLEADIIPGVRSYLGARLEEKEHRESLPHKIFESLGF